MVIKKAKFMTASKIAFLFVFTNAAEALKEIIVGNSKSKILELQRVLVR